MASLEELVTAHGQALFRLAFVLTGSRPAAEDLYQETWMKAQQKWSRVSAAVSPGPYLKKVMVNIYTSQRRKGSSTEIPMDIHPGASESRPGPDAALADRDELWQLVQRLPYAERAAIVLRYYEDLSDQEAAELLGCRASTVRSNTSRALSRLRSQANPEGSRP